MVWLALSTIIGALGKRRKIGFSVAFIISIVLSPITGLIVIIFSKKIEFDTDQTAHNLNVNKEPLHLMSQIYDWLEAPHQLQQYKNLLDSGAITQEEYEVKKKQLLDL
jgi:hypothetical protein